MNTGNHITKWSLRGVAYWAMLVYFLVCMISVAFGNSFQDIKFTALSGNKVRIDLVFSNSIQNPGTFSIEKPARVVLDFANVKSELDKKNFPIDVGMVKSLIALESKNHTRVVVNLLDMVDYDVTTKGNVASITLDSNKNIPTNKTLPPLASSPVKKKLPGKQLLDIDFRRDYEGTAKIQFKLSDPSIPVDIQDNNGKVILKFLKTKLPAYLANRLDVGDFGTPVKLIDTRRRQNNVQVTIAMAGEYDQLVYQTDKLLTVEIRPLTKEEKKKLAREKREFTGERLSLNFQDVSIRAVLQLLADFTGLNVVASDTVQGSVTLRLQNVPWDQALDIILKSKGLDKRQVGNVLMIAPSEEIATRERLELESEQQVEELAPLRSEFVQINYAKASTLAALLKSEANSLLSARGNVTVDERTNTLLVQDTSQKLQEVREIVAKLDTPIRQVEIESRLVSAQDSFTKDLGIRWGSIASYTTGAYRIGAAGTLTDANNRALDNAVSSIEDRLNVNMPISGEAGRLALSLARLGADTILDLELTAAQNDSLAKVIASPRLITSNKQEAVIKQGTEIPYLEASSSGATSIAFREAVLELRVTPQITPDNRVILDLNVKQDALSSTTVTAQALPVINTKEVQTQVLVDNGETIVLGGIYEHTKNNSVKKVPFFGDMPVVGRLFKNDTDSDLRNELLIFVTPKIVYEQMSAR